MTIIELSRRGFIAGSSAAAVVLATPAVASVAAAETVVLLPQPPKWCFSTSSDVFDLYHATKEDAIRAGLAYHGDEPFEIGTYESHVASVPDRLSETVAESLLNDGHVVDDIVASIASQNEECDFDGEFEDEVWTALEKDQTFSKECLAVVTTAIVRHGFPEVAAQIGIGRIEGEVPETLLKAIETDEQLDTDLHEIVAAFMERHDLYTAGRSITLSNHETYFPPMAREQDHGEGC